MRFSKGLWQMLEDVEPTYPVRVHEVRRTSDSMVVVAADRADGGRGSYVGGSSLTIRLSSPMPDVVRVTITHFAGAKSRGPEFILEKDGASVETREDENGYAMTSGRLRVELPRSGAWQYRFVGDDKPLTTSGPRALGLMKKAGKTYMREQLSL